VKTESLSLLLHLPTKHVEGEAFGSEKMHNNNNSLNSKKREVAVQNENVVS